MKYGLVCISELLRDKEPELKFKTMTRTQFLKGDREKSILELSKRIFHNLVVTAETIKHCADNRIRHYRLSCKIFPLITDKTLQLEIEVFPNYANIMQKMIEIGQLAKSLNVSISIHPDQFVVLGSASDDVCKKSVDELNFHAWVLDSMGLPDDYTCPINIHPSLSNFESPEKFIQKFVTNFFQCGMSVRNRLVLENEHHGFWNCNNLFEYFQQYMRQAYSFGFPLTFDNLHDEANPSFDGQGQKIPMATQFLKFYKTWPVNPVFHWSEAKAGTKHDHAQKLSSPPADFGVDVTWEIEVKDKDKGFIHYVKNTTH
jgi:UV DNA damage endonuclease